MPRFKLLQECDNCGYWTDEPVCPNCDKKFPDQEYQRYDEEDL